MTGAEYAAVAGGVTVAGVVWVFMFRLERRDIWPRTWVAAGVLSGYSVGASVVLGDGRRLMGRISFLEVAIGLTVGVAWLVATHLGAAVLSRLVPSFRDEISDLYRLTEGGAVARIAGPVAAMAVAEELLFRGLIQARTGIFVAVAIYAVVQVVERKRALVLAAVLGGVVWGELFAWRHSLIAPIVAHAVWTLALTLIWPIGEQESGGTKPREAGKTRHRSTIANAPGSTGASMQASGTDKGDAAGEKHR